MLGLLFTQQLFAQQPDSTTIKLGQYKDYFDRGLINGNEYQLLKEKLLQLGKFAPVTRRAVNDSSKQYNKKLTFEIRVEPTAFFSVHDVNNFHGFDSNTGAFHGQQQSSGIAYGGMSVAIGAAINKRYHLHLEVAYDGTPGETLLTTGAGFSYNILPGKVSPFVHISGGYATVNGDLEGIESGGPPYLGFYGCTGFGVSIQVAKMCAITLSPDYRFIYGHAKNTYNYAYYDNNGNIAYQSGWQKNNLLNNQIGIRLAAVFY